MGHRSGVPHDARKPCSPIPPPRITRSDDSVPRRPRNCTFEWSNCTLERIYCTLEWSNCTLDRVICNPDRVAAPAAVVPRCCAPTGTTAPTSRSGATGPTRMTGARRARTCSSRTPRTTARRRSRRYRSTGSSWRCRWTGWSGLSRSTGWISPTGWTTSTFPRRHPMRWVGGRGVGQEASPARRWASSAGFVNIGQWPESMST